MCGFDLDLAGETAEVSFRDLLGAIATRKIGSWEEQEETGSTGVGLRAKEFLRLRSEECSREEREDFLKDNLRKPSINEAVVSERRV